MTPRRGLLKGSCWLQLVTINAGWSGNCEEKKLRKSVMNGRDRVSFGRRIAGVASLAARTAGHTRRTKETLGKRVERIMRLATCLSMLGGLQAMEFVRRISEEAGL
jgi:hypothetical protein